MEKRTISKTLGEGFLGCDDIPKVANSVLLCNLNEKNYGGDASHVEFDAELGSRMITESSLDDGIDGKDEINNVTEGSKGSEVKDDVAIWKGDSPRGTDGQIQRGKVEELVKKGNVLHCTELASPATIEVAGKGINLYVEVFGPMDGMSEGTNDLSDKEVQASGNCDANVGAEGYGQQDHKFDVGDLVWVKTRSQLWWPGMISDPSDAASEVLEFEKGACFLVKYFGNANGAWCVCNRSELKPFIEYFDLLSSQTTSRNFVGSVEKALCEVGLRVKSAMTCRCFLKGSQKIASRFLEKTEGSCLMPQSARHKLDSLSQFDCSDFVARIRDLARCVREPGKIQLILMKNQLSAFYRSIGHLELPMELVKSSSDVVHIVKDGPMPEVMDEGHDKESGPHKNSVKTRDEDRYALRGKRNCNDTDQAHGDKVSSSGKTIESRERKKSKYLTFPYVEVENGRNTKVTGGKEAEDPLHNSNSLTKSTQGRSNGVIPRKRGLQKSFKGCRIVCRSDNINASPSELLSELHGMARDCFHVQQSKYSDSLMRFFCSFRTSAFLNTDKSGKVSRNQQEPDCEKGNPENSTETEELTKGTKVAKASKKLKVNCASVQEAADKVIKAVDKVVDDQVSTTIDPQGNARGSVKMTVNEVAENKVAETNNPQSEGNASVKKTADEVVNNLLVSETEVSEAIGSASVEKTAEMVVISHVAETNDPQGIGRRKKFKGQPSTSKCPSKENKRMPKLKGVRMLNFELYCSEVLQVEAPKKSEGCGQQSRSNCSGTGKNGTAAVKEEECGQQSRRNCSGTGKNETAADKEEGCAQQSTSNCVGTNGKAFPDGSCVISFQQTFPDVPKSETSPEKTQGLNPVLPQINSVARLPDLNGNHLNESVEQIPLGGPSADLSKPLTKQGAGGLATPNLSGIHQMAFPSIPSLKDTSSTIAQNVREVNDPINGTNHFQTADIQAIIPGPNVAINSQIISFVQPSVKMEPFQFACNPDHKKRKRKQQVASVIPDLNGHVLDTNTSGKVIPEGIPIAPPGMPPPKKGKNISASGESGSKGKSNEDPGGSVLLSFAAGSDLPPKDILVATFSRFGLLKESEIQVLDGSTVQIVYERSNDAKFAFRSLERNNPFGETLANFKLHCTVPDPKASSKKSNFQLPQPFTPIALGTAQPAKPMTGIPDVASMRMSMERMKTTLEKQGHNISPEMRAKLETDIKAFLNKLNTMGGSSSS